MNTTDPVVGASSRVEQPIRAEVFGIERLAEHAESLAAAQPTADARVKGRRLLPRVRENGKVLLAGYQSIVEAVGQKRQITQAEEWLLDNFHVVDGQIREIRDHLPRSFYRLLPKIAEGFHLGGYPRVYGLASCFGAVGDWTLDADRHATETIDPPLYLRASYYEKWLLSMETLLMRHGYASRAELASGKMQEAARPVDTVLTSDNVEAFVHNASLSSRPSAADPVFAVGDIVRTRRTQPPGHTRLPRYARGHVGEIDRIHGCHIFPDTNAHDQGEQPQWLYSVRFTATELWGDGQPERTDIFIDLWEPYLGPA